MIRKIVALVALFGTAPSLVFGMVPNDSFYADQWYLEKIQAPAAWEVTTGSEQVVVAVIDTGVDLHHADLETNIWNNSGDATSNRKDDDGNGFIDDVHGWDFVDDDANPEPEYDADFNDGGYSHGTFIAGVIGATTNNVEGYAGISWDVAIMPLRVLDADGTGSEDDVAAAIGYAVDNGADVINMSFAGNFSNSTLRRAVQEAYESGVVIVAALGNEGRDVDEDPVYPACLRSSADDWVIGVTATDQYDTQTLFTNYGKSCADLSAPGTGAYGLGYQDTSVADSSLYSGPWSGTSVASPMVAGAAALILAEHPSLTPDDVRTALKLSVDPFTLSYGGVLGVGRLNIARSLEVAASLAAQQVDEEPVEVEDEETEETTPGGVSAEHETYFALGAPAGERPWVRIYQGNGTLVTEFLAYGETFLGGVNVVLSDLDADGVPEVITAPGVGGGPQIRLFKLTGAVIREFFAYDQASRLGAAVTSGDVDGDGDQDIVTAVGGTVSNEVVVYSSSGKEQSRFMVSGFAAGTRLRVAVGDLDKDTDAEIVVSAANLEPRVAVYNHDGSKLVDFLAYAPNMDAGVYINTGDMDSDGRDEIVVAPGKGGAAHVRVFTTIGALWSEFYAFDRDIGNGAIAGVANTDNQGNPEIVVIPAGGPGSVRIYAAKGTLLREVGIALPSQGAFLSAW